MNLEAALFSKALATTGPSAEGWVEVLVVAGLLIFGVLIFEFKILEKAIKPEGQLKVDEKSYNPKPSDAKVSSTTNSKALLPTSSHPKEEALSSEIESPLQSIERDQAPTQANSALINGVEKLNSDYKRIEADHTSTLIEENFRTQDSFQSSLTVEDKKPESDLKDNKSYSPPNVKPTSKGINSSKTSLRITNKLRAFLFS